MQSSMTRKQMRENMIVFLLAVGIALFIPPVAMAEATEKKEVESSKEEKDAAYTLEPIVITAEKRKTDVQKTPVAVTVFTAGDIEDNNYKTIKDVLQNVPNLMQVNHIGGNSQVGFRGAITSMGTETTPIVVYIDGVPVDSYSALDASLMNIERIEVLRGAQSALYGKNAFAGVVNIISQKPDNTHTGKVVGDVGSEISNSVAATISGPIVEDKLFYSLSASREYRDGYMDLVNTDNKDNNELNVRLKGQLRLLLDEDSEFNLHMSYNNLSEGPMPVVQGQSPSFKSPANGADFRDKENFNVALHGTNTFETTQLTSITTFRTDRMRATHDVGAYFAGGFNSEYAEESYELTQELRLQGQAESDDALNWLVGVYGGYRNFDRSKWSAPAMNLNYPHKDELVEAAPFGQVVLPFADDFKLTTGLRWQYVSRKAEIKTTGPFTVDKKGNETWTEFLPKVVLSYDVSDDDMLFIGANRSFLPGGFSRQVNAGTHNLKYKPQYAWNYEVGAKTAWLDKRLIANLTLFYSTYEDMHVTDFTLGPPAGPIATNAGEVTAYGAEFDMSMKVTEKLMATGSLGYTNAKYDEYKTDTADYSGNKVHYTPDYTANLSMVYRQGNGWMGQIGVLRTGKMYWDAANTVSRSATTIVDCKVGYEFESLDVYLYSKNLFDQRYLTLYEKVADYGLVAPGREVGLQVIYHW